MTFPSHPMKLLLITQL